MDESWRMRIGTPVLGRPLASPTGPTALDPEDFSDVFGGPPQTVLLRKFSGDHASSSSPSFYGQIFRQQGASSPSKRGGGGGLSSPAFRIPAASEAFYEDVFGSYGDRKSRDRSRPGSNVMSKSKSKSNSSSALSSEELSPLRPVVRDDVGLSSFASKLRPINVPCRWNSAAKFPSEHQQMQGTPVFPCGRPSVVEDQSMDSVYKLGNFRSPHSGLSRRAPSPEPLAVDPNSHPSVKLLAEEVTETNSPSSVISSIFQCPEAEGRRVQLRDRPMEEWDAVALDEDEISSSYVIEIASGIRDGAGETPGVDEAIAWAKEKFNNAQGDAKESCNRTKNGIDHIIPEMKEKPKASDQATIVSGKSKSSQMMEFEVLDRNMKLWTSGKERDIRLLLSTLHQIMWPDSGWEAVPLTCLKESSQVKKAYQKARLCLHPDKLQQRGATFLHKYIAQKAFSILQDSWTKYISEGDIRSDHTN